MGENICKSCIYKACVYSIHKNSLCYATSLQSCLTLCNPIDCRPLGSSVHGILQARILEWVAMPSSRGSSQPGDQTHVSLCLLHWQAGSLPLASPEKPTVNTYSSPKTVVSFLVAVHLLQFHLGMWIPNYSLCFPTLS